MAAALSEVRELDIELARVPQPRQQVAALILRSGVVSVAEDMHAERLGMHAHAAQLSEPGVVRSNTNSLHPSPPRTVVSLRSSKPRAVQKANTSSGAATSNG